jgi:hypothetical protein
MFLLHKLYRLFTAWRMVDIRFRQIDRLRVSHHLFDIRSTFCTRLLLKQSVDRLLNAHRLVIHLLPVNVRDRLLLRGQWQLQFRMPSLRIKLQGHCRLCAALVLLSVNRSVKLVDHL